MAADLYLAYGSNLHPRWLRSRVPSATILRKITLQGWLLHFNKQSHSDHSAKCNIIHTGIDNDYVHGIIYRYNRQEKPELDRAEGGYVCTELQLPDIGCVMVYLARPEAINNSLQPYTWYRDIVIAGAIWHGLPEAYVNLIRSVNAIPDPDRERELTYRSIVWPE